MKKGLAIFLLICLTASAIVPALAEAGTEGMTGATVQETKPSDDRQPPEMNGQQPPEMNGQQPPEMDGQQPPEMNSQQPPEMNGEQPAQTEGEQPAQTDGEQPEQTDGQQPSEMKGKRQRHNNGQRPPMKNGKHGTSLDGIDIAAIREQAAKLEESEDSRKLAEALNTYESLLRQRHPARSRKQGTEGTEAEDSTASALAEAKETILTLMKTLGLSQE